MCGDEILKGSAGAIVHPEELTKAQRKGRKRQRRRELEQQQWRQQQRREELEHRRAISVFKKLRNCEIEH